MNVGRAIVCGLSPAIGGWLEVRERPRTERDRPFIRRPRPTDFLIATLGVIVLAVGLILDNHVVWLIGACYVAMGSLRPIARALTPQRFAKTEVQFVLLTSPETLFRLGLWMLFAAELIRGQWVGAFIVGSLVLSSLVLSVAVAIGATWLRGKGTVMEVPVDVRRERTMTTATRWPSAGWRTAEHHIDPRQAFPRLESLGYG